MKELVELAARLKLEADNEWKQASAAYDRVRESTPGTVTEKEWVAVHSSFGYVKGIYHTLSQITDFIEKSKNE